MPLTRAQIRSQIRLSISDEASEMFSDSALDVLTGMVYDEKWIAILEKNPLYNRQLDAVTPVSPGYIDIDLVADGGLLSQRFHRLQNVFRADRMFREIDQRDVAFQSSGGVPDSAVVYAPDYRYAWMGDRLWLYPLDFTLPVEVRYSYLPPVYTGLLDTAQIVWPTGCEGHLTASVSARAERNTEMRRGWQEIVAETWPIVLAQITRRTHYMKVGWSPDTAESWGGI